MPNGFEDSTPEDLVHGALASLAAADHFLVITMKEEQRDELGVETAVFASSSITMGSLIEMARQDMIARFTEGYDEDDD